MPDSMERSALHVEGKDDLYSVANLLIRHGIDYDPKPWPPEFPRFLEAGSVDRLLLGMQEAIRLATGRVVGFVLDADSPLQDRWRAVRDRLLAVDVDAPRELQAGGFVGRSTKYHAAVGVWLMPDNQHDGTLESFLRTLIDERDGLIGYAADVTGKAKDRGAEFSDLDRPKAVLHTWLAWQQEPGKPYGTAIRAKYFRHDTDVATSFVAWFKQLYRIA
jgi:hypothetical protein